MIQHNGSVVRLGTPTQVEDREEERSCWQWVEGRESKHTSIKSEISHDHHNYTEKGIIYATFQQAGTWFADREREGMPPVAE